MKAEQQTASGQAKSILMLYPKDLLDQIEDYRFKHRFATRVDAIKELLRLGLESAKKGPAK